MVRLGLCINWLRSPWINGQVGCNSRVLLVAFMGTALSSQPKDYGTSLIMVRDMGLSCSPNTAIGSYLHNLNGVV